MHHIMATVATIFIGILLISGVLYAMNVGFSNSKLSDVQSTVVMMQMQVQSMFSGSSSYSGLNNDLVVTNNIVPTNMLKGGKVSNPWGGDVTLSPEDNGAAFSIALTSVPRSECTKLALFQPDAWLSVTVNSSTISGGDVAAATSACNSDKNSIIFTSR